MEVITTLKQPGDEFDDLLETPYCDSSSLSAKEREVLKLWDQLEEHRLEHALLEARADATTHAAASVSDDALPAHLEAAQKEALEARAAYVLRNRIVQQTLITDPILKTIHTGVDGEAPSQRLLGIVNERDVLAMINSKLSRDLQSASNELTGLEKQAGALRETNRELASAMLALTGQAHGQETEDVEDPDLRQEGQRLDREVKFARRDWRVMKSVVSAVVAGSGVDWARDEALTELVLNDERDL